MKKDPAFLFYPSDFLTGTMFMSNEDIGIYIRLLCSQHQHGGIIDKVSFNSLVGERGLLKSKFIETDIGFYNERLAQEISKRSIKSSNMSEAVKKVWESRKNGIAMELHSNSNAKVNKKDALAMELHNKSNEILMLPVNRDIDVINNSNTVLNNNKEKKENLETELLNSFSMIENIGMELKLKKEDVNSQLKKFIQTQKSETNFEGRELSDLQKHFPRWLRKQDMSQIKPKQMYQIFNEEHKNKQIIT